MSNQCVTMSTIFFLRGKKNKVEKSFLFGEITSGRRHLIDFGWHLGWRIAEGWRLIVIPSKNIVFTKFLSKFPNLRDRYTV